MRKILLIAVMAPFLLLSCTQKTEEEISNTLDSATQKVGDAAQSTIDTIQSRMDSGSVANRQEITVTLSDFKIDMPMQLKAGQTRFNVSNTGKTEHSFELEGKSGDADRKNDRLVANLDPGASTHLDVDLQPGEYTVYCPVGNHADRGMKHTVTVK
jgi:uncharacterized cupredoxin-like copper-binding protein